MISDAMHVKMHDAECRMVKNKAVCIASGLIWKEEREVLGFWVLKNEGTMGWLGIRNEMGNRASRTS